MMRSLVVLLLILLAGRVWAGADVATLEGLSAGQLDKVGAILAQQQRNFMEPCGNIKVLKAEALSVAIPVTLGADGKPTGGLWRVRYAVDACGKAGLRMVEFHPVTGGIALEALVPGETLTDAKLQDDVRKSFMMAGQVMMPKCVELPVIRDTKVRVYPSKPTDRWQEIWTGRMCGRDLGQMVEFMPTKHGTTFKMSLPVKSAQ